MPASHNVHPEFGFLCPTPRFRRRLRLVLAGLVVAGIGAGVMAATGGSKPDAAANRVDAAYLCRDRSSREHTAVLCNRRAANSRGCRWVWVDRRREASLRRRHPVRAHLSRGQAAQAAHGPGGHRSPSHRCRGYRPQHRSRHGHDRCGAFRRRRIKRHGEGKRSRGRGRDCHRIRKVRYHGQEAEEVGEPAEPSPRPVLVWRSVLARGRVSKGRVWSRRLRVQFLVSPAAGTPS